MKYPTEVKIAVSISVDNVTQDGRQVKKTGLTSAYIKKIQDDGVDLANTRITHRLFIKDSSFKKPESVEKTPMIMVGPGTGVVPFIGFMQDREILRQN